MSATAYYVYPKAGVQFSGTTAPTAAEALHFNSLSATVFMGDTDTTVDLTHNWGLSTTALAYLQPWAQVYPQATAAVTLVLAFVALATNSVTLNKNSLTGSGGIFTVLLQRPFSEST
jgi:hypothetical protein